MAGVNKVILIGHLGKDPEVRHLEGGSVVANFTLATTETFTRDGNRMEQTEWHNIVMWRGLAEIAEKYLSKGKLVYIEGKIKTRAWEDKEGNKKYTTEIIADNMTMLGSKSEDKNSVKSETPIQPGYSLKPNSEPNSFYSNDDMEDGLPF
jgi:single-strand DNA-binding protein